MEQKPHLIIIPIAHTYTDMGSPKEQVPYDEGYEAAATRYWLQVFKYVESLQIDFTHLRIYQDGLADTDPGIVKRIIEETQTANYEILRTLKGKGALIIGTEDPSLLAEEHQSLQAIFNSPDEVSRKAARLKYTERCSGLLEERDEYIAQRIRLTLGPGETGLLFIGVAHNVEGFLAKEIEVSEPETLKASLPVLSLREFWGMGKERK